MYKNDLLDRKKPFPFSHDPTRTVVLTEKHVQLIDLHFCTAEIASFPFWRVDSARKSLCASKNFRIPN